MKVVLIVFVCFTLLLGVFNTFWFERDENYLVTYVERINLVEVFGTFTALEDYSRAMLGELQDITELLDDLVDVFGAFGEIENFGDAMLAILGLLGGLLYFLTAMVYHILAIIVIQLYSVVQLIIGICNLLLGL